MASNYPILVGVLTQAHCRGRGHGVRLYAEPDPLFLPVLAALVPPILAVLSDEEESRRAEEEEGGLQIAFPFETTVLGRRHPYRGIPVLVWSDGYAIVRPVDTADIAWSVEGLSLGESEEDRLIEDYIDEILAMDDSSRWLAVYTRPDGRPILGILFSSNQFENFLCGGSFPDLSREDLARIMGFIDPTGAVINEFSSEVQDRFLEGRVVVDPGTTEMIRRIVEPYESWEVYKATKDRILSSVRDPRSVKEYMAAYEELENARSGFRGHMQNIDRLEGIKASDAEILSVLEETAPWIFEQVVEILEDLPEDVIEDLVPGKSAVEISDLRGFLEEGDEDALERLEEEGLDLEALRSRAVREMYDDSNPSHEIVVAMKSEVEALQSLVEVGSVHERSSREGWKWEIESSSNDELWTLEFDTDQAGDRQTWALRDRSNHRHSSGEEDPPGFLWILDQADALVEIGDLAKGWDEGLVYEWPGDPIGTPLDVFWLLDEIEPLRTGGFPHFVLVSYLSNRLTPGEVAWFDAEWGEGWRPF